MSAEGASHRARVILWLAAVVSIGSAMAWSIYPLENAAGRLRTVPLRSGAFAGVDVPLTETEKKVLGRVDVVHRLYRYGADRAVYVTLIDGSKDRHAVHDPRYCFRGAGWRVVQESGRALPGGDAAWMRAESSRGWAEAAFWFSDGAERYASLPRYLLASVLRRITFGRAGGKPVLVVVQSFDRRPLEPATLSSLVEELGL